MLYYNAMDKFKVSTEDMFTGTRAPSLDYAPSDKETALLIEKLSEILSLSGWPMHDDSRFPSEVMERELVEICSGIAEYAHENDVPSIMLLDRSARPAYLGIREAWKRKYSDEARPDIYFVNPTGFLDIRSGLKFNRDHMTLQGVVAMLNGRAKDNEMGNFFTDSRTKPVVDADFLATYTKLSQQKESPLLLVDTCLHSGDSVRPLMKTLDRLGFSDVRLALVSNTDNDSEIEPDVVIMDGDPALFCYPFSSDTMTERTFDSVVSEKTKDREKALSAVALRKEVSQIFRDAPDDWF